MIIFDKQDASKILPFELIIVISFSLEMKTKKFPFDNTSTATTKTSNTEQYRTNISNIIINLEKVIEQHRAFANTAIVIVVKNDWFRMLYLGCVVLSDSQGCTY